ncbi:dihydrolipoamide acetyltransferase family protein [Streptomyces gobiensis]|uniref:dihydrolipoamide acetyltransferase family protein n=1 Tax=Streptomyces gobiensis TaxID=2875706 RepID=UPI001E36E088|nr:dihydrolipoamide acetyltransferase family protein [Streptomyces gobiensis]UGY92641.1 2-oxo acid dehydrogenase subunit E2 [Streptomyces gobiensis]
MAEVREFTLPDLGEGLTEAEITRWLVEVGEVVAVDQPVVEVETAKALVEVPCPYGGVVTARYGDAGDEIPVGAPLVTVASGTLAEQPDAGSGNVLVGYGTSAPRARTRPVLGAPPGGTSQTESGGGSWGRLRTGGPGAESPVTGRGGTGDNTIAVISPLVRRLAREQGIDLREITGSGPDGLILRADVERRAASTPEAATGERIPLKGVRGAVAEKLARSRREIPEATCWVDADATELLAARRVMDVPLLAVLARICTAALARHPELNATVDTEAREIVRLPAVHLGFAAQTDRGLVVPVVRDAHARNAQDLGAEMTRLTEAARAGQLPPAELTGGTFTLNNYGVFGVDGSTPIINFPEAAMLGVGRITPKPWVHEGELAVRHVVQLSLTFDHRVCDGGTAGGFLRYVADCVEQPAVLLRTL